MRQSAAEFAHDNLSSLFRFALALCGSAADAEDLVSEAMTRALPHWDQIEISPKAYMRRTMINIRLNEQRRRASERPSTDPSPSVDFEETLIERVRLAHMLALLDPVDRTILVLRFLEDMPTRSVAEVLMCSMPTVRRLTRRALATARAAERSLMTIDRKSAE